jgi:hypothetical protein
VEWFTVLSSRQQQRLLCEPGSEQQKLQTSLRVLACGYLYTHAGSMFLHHAADLHRCLLCPVLLLCLLLQEDDAQYIVVRESDILAALA